MKGFVKIGILFLVISCDMTEVSNQIEIIQEQNDEKNCIEGNFVVNLSYTTTDGRMGPPFPFIRYSFCRLVKKENMVSFGFEFGDARKTPQAKFTLEFMDFSLSNASAVYVHSTFQALTEFAVENALSKWLNCRDQIRSKKRFVIDSCLEINSEYITKIEFDRSRYPCGINVGPESVGNHAGNEVPESIYSGQRHSLTGGFVSGEKMMFKKHDTLEKLFIPLPFLQDISYEEKLPSCGAR